MLMKTVKPFKKRKLLRIHDQVAMDMAEPEDEDQVLRFGSSSSDPHPLLIPNIIHDVLKNLPLPEVSKSRTVCRQWNEEACRVIQKSQTITFTHNSGIISYMKCYPAPPEGGSLISRPIHLTYQMYKIDFVESNLELQRFLVAHGSHIQTLILQQSHAVYEKELYWALENHLTNLETLWLRSIPVNTRRIPTVPMSTKMDKDKLGVLPSSSREYNFPTVKHLIVGTQSFVSREVGIPPAAAIVAGGGDGAPPPGNGDGGDGFQFHQIAHAGHAPIRGDDTVIRISFVKLLSSLPNLQTISCSTLDNMCDGWGSMTILRSLVQVPAIKLRNLVRLNFPLHVTSPILEGLNALSLINLSEMNIHFAKTVEVPEARQLFMTVGPNLQKLSLSLPNDFPYGRFIRIPGHEMRRLKYMNLNRYRWSLDFLENVTALKVLICVDMPIPTIFPINLKYEHGLSELKIQGREYPIRDSEVVSRITRAFPTLRTLHIPGINDDCLRVIYTDLPFLKDLACTDGEFTDCGISGVSLEVCNDLAETMTYLFVNPDKFRRDLFIGNLTNLKRLCLESNLMTHLSVLFGIVKCGRLEHLNLKSDKLNDTAIESIADQMICSLKILNVINCPQVTEAGKFFARERIPNLKVYVSGDAVEDPEQIERIKLQTRHAQFDAISRRRARDRPESPRDLQRRRIAFRALNRDYHQGGHGLAGPPLGQPPPGAAVAMMNAPPPPQQPPAMALDHFYEMQLHDLQDPIENELGNGGVMDFDDMPLFGNFYDEMGDDSSTDGEDEMNYFE